MKKKTIIGKIITAVLAAAIMLSALGACSLFPSEDNIKAPALKTPKPISYNFYQVVKGNLVKGSTGTGSVTSIYYYRHAFPTSDGVIKSINVTLGQHVNKGDVLVETDNSELELSYLEATIAYTESKATFDDLTARYNRGEVSDTQFRIEQLKFQYVETKYLNLKNSYENTKLIAQVSGTVVYINTDYTTNTNKKIVAGETIVAIDSGEEKYMYLVFDKSIEAQNDSSATPQQFRVGTVLTLSLNPTKADPDPIKFEGVIVGTDQIIKDTGIGYVDTAKYYCKITSFPDYGGDESRKIETGTLIRYTYVEDSREDVLIIPVNTCYEYNGKHYVYMLDHTTNLKKEVYIELGLANESYVEVVSGLKRGDRIITG